MHLIFGLGNPGEKYASTRHNFGFLAADRLAQKFEFEPFTSSKKFSAEMATGFIDEIPCRIFKPETFMNLSGHSVAAAANFFQVSPQNIWVIFDDADLDFGAIRFRESGSSGGHRGTQSIISALATQNFPRIKLGISNPNREKIPLDAFALQKFLPEESEQIPEILNQFLQIFVPELKLRSKPD